MLRLDINAAVRLRKCLHHDPNIQGALLFFHTPPYAKLLHATGPRGLTIMNFVVDVGIPKARLGLLLTWRRTQYTIITSYYPDTQYRTAC